MTNTDWKNSSDFTFTTFFPHLHLSHSVSICVVVSSPCAPSDCDAWGQKSTASCLDFNMVLSVLASLKKKKKKTKNFLYQPYHYSNFVSKPPRQFCTQTFTCKCCPPPFLPSTLGAIFVAIKNKAVVLLEIHFVYGLFGHFGCEVKEMIFQKPFDFSLPPKMVRVW